MMMFARLRSVFGGMTAVAVLALLVIALALIAGIVYMLNQQSTALVDAFRPTVESRGIIGGSIERMQEEGKFVVLTADVTAVAESSSDMRIFFDLIDAGRTTVRIRAPARVQYVIPLDAISRDDFFYDPETKRLLLTLPNPRLDTTIVEVTTDPDEMEILRDVGWLRLGPLAGRYDEERARRLLRDAAIQAGLSGAWLPRAQASARQQMRQFLKPLITSLEENVAFEIAFVQSGRPMEGVQALPTPAR